MALGAAALGAAAPAGAATVYFSVGVPGPERDLNGAYVLPLSAPADIAMARQLAANQGGNLIVFAVVQQGADGINRNWYKSGKPLWHWHVVQFQGFDAVGIELCDGTPDQVEATMLSAPAGTQRQICFWGWRVLEEIVPVPLGAPTWGMVKACYR